MVTGEVTYAGTYSISNKNERISDVVKRAGGLVPGAYIKGATLMRSRELSAAELVKKKQLKKLMVSFSSMANLKKFGWLKAQAKSTKVHQNII